METKTSPKIVQSLIGVNQLPFYLKCLKSLTEYCEEEIELILHTDGTLTEYDNESVIANFLNQTVRLSDPKQMEQKVLDNLQGRPHCQRIRRESIWGIEFFDPLFARISDPISLYLDADILFFRPFRGLFNSMEIEGGAVFLKDSQWDSYCLRPWHLIGIGKKPKIVLLENVDRLLKSPTSQRGRDFAVMLKSLNDLGYAVEWRVVNAGEYGMPQRRRRIFFIGYHKSTDIYKRIAKSKIEDWLDSNGTIASAFPIEKIEQLKEVKIDGDLVQITNEFNKNGKLSPFKNTGLLFKGKVFTCKTIPNYNGKRTLLKDVLQNGEVSEEFFIKDKDLKNPKTIINNDGSQKILSTEKDMWEYLKGAKKEKRRTKDGFEYNYGEGRMIFPDALDNASRTVITGEGGSSPSRFKHVILSERGLRRLTPVELERLNMFPDDHTKLEGITDAKRAFFMGNALVVGVVEKIGSELYKQIKYVK